jgi:hypothetical protein
MKNARISTTISQKHAAMLKKHTEQYGSQQCALEHALESLDNGSNQNSELSIEQQFILQTWADKVSCVSNIECFKWLMETADLDQYKIRFDDVNPMVYTLEYIYQKSFKEFSLKEIIEGIDAALKISNWFDTLIHTDDGDYYMLKIYHSIGMKGSKLILMLIEGAIKAYDTDYESTVSEKSVFIKIYKT